jgi:hypothetical protein
MAENSTERAAEYRRQAEECRLQAERARSEDDKVRWLKSLHNRSEWRRKSIRHRNVG